MMFRDLLCAPRGAVVGMAFVVGLVPTSSLAFMDNGGRISRDVAVGNDGREMLYVAWQGGGGQHDNTTLFAFCADGQSCSWAGSPNSCAIDGTAGDVVVATHCNGDPFDDRVAVSADPGSQEPSQPCMWKVQLPYSRGDISFSPPTASPDGKLIVIATRDKSTSAVKGRIYGFDPDGNCRFVYEPSDDSLVQNGFYARPSIHAIDDDADPEFDEYLVFLGSRKNGKLHVIRDRGLSQAQLNENSIHTAHHVVGDSPGGELFFEPLVDPGCGTASAPRVYVGAHAGASNRGLYAFDVTNPAGGQISLTLAWDFRESHLSLPAGEPGGKLGYRLGGVLVESGTSRYVVGSLRQGDGVVSLKLADAVGATCTTNRPTAAAKYAEGRDTDNSKVFVTEVHRTRPVQTWEPTGLEDCTQCPGTCPSGCEPVVYIGQKQGFFNNAAVHRFDPNSTTALPQAEWSWPRCAGHNLGHTSWASPTVHPGSGDIFIGNNQNYGIHRVRLDGSTCPPGDQSPPNEWYPYRPSGGWRTTAAYSGSTTELVHIGGSYRVMYSLDTASDTQGSLVWCYDMSLAPASVAGTPGASCPSTGTCCDLGP